MESIDIKNLSLVHFNCASVSYVDRSSDQMYLATRRAANEILRGEVKGKVGVIKREYNSNPNFTTQTSYQLATPSIF